MVEVTGAGGPQKATEDAQLAALSELKTDVFSSHLDSMGSRYLQQRKYEASLREAAAVVVALDTTDGIGGTGGGVGELIGGAQVSAVAVGETGNFVVWYASSVVVEEGWRGRGVGRALTERLIELARSTASSAATSEEQGGAQEAIATDGGGGEGGGAPPLQGPVVTALYLHVAKENTAARALYERAGFMPVGSAGGEEEVSAVESENDVPEGELLLCLRIVEAAD